ncbi:uncharacterized protein At3g27210-like [Zingiber officinale]|uniref:Uncharacterized protein n=1 Tax=Zingiber officinale TaxID=94328 RepID=A0A8J5LTV9_ZINOF|nr:uncharacterized protein At3g27210-like [Zingiber officinale]KAG6530148.1 hypothetical protein ZIOFF_012370 [Zingiber officinale]
MRRCLGFGSRAKRFFLSSPAKERPLTWDNPVGRFDLDVPDFEDGELFFDSKVWLDSDCEDDFFSVNGDSTPSRGNTPDHPANQQSNPVLDDAIFIDKHLDTKSEPSPTGRKKLSDLLQETSRGERVIDAPTAAEANTETNGMTEVEKDRSRGLSNGNQYLSSNSADEAGVTTPRRDKKKKGKTWKDGHCCLPSLQVE